jgi:hypothetical protein
MASFDPNKHHEVYCYLMMRRGNGYAPYIPDPDANLPLAYREDGMNICDVLLLTPDGGYDYLFNCSLPEDHPKNSQPGVPTMYVPFELRSWQHRNIPGHYPAGIPISSAGDGKAEIMATVTYHPTTYVSFRSQAQVKI